MLAHLAGTAFRGSASARGLTRKDTLSVWTSFRPRGPCGCSRSRGGVGIHSRSGGNSFTGCSVTTRLNTDQPRSAFTQHTVVFRSGGGLPLSGGTIERARFLPTASPAWKPFPAGHGTQDNNRRTEPITCAGCGPCGRRGGGRTVGGLGRLRDVRSDTELVRSGERALAGGEADDAEQESDWSIPMSPMAVLRFIASVTICKQLGHLVSSRWGDGNGRVVGGEMGVHRGSCLPGPSAGPLRSFLHA